jgi:hypothetical protein
VLMHGGFPHGGRGYFLLATLGGIVTFSCGALARPSQPMLWRPVICGGAGVVVMTLAILVATRLQGTSLSTLISGVVLSPLQHPKTFYIPFDVSRPELVVALLALMGVICLRWGGVRVGDSRWLDVLRCVVGIGSILVLPVLHRIDWVVGLLPLTLIPPSRGERSTGAVFCRLFITDMAVTQFLGAYPVAGSHLGIASAPMLLWAFLCTADGMGGLSLRPWTLLQKSWLGFRLDAAVGGLILIVFATTGVTMAITGTSQLSPASRLNGSAWLHLPGELEAQFEPIVRSVAANCRMLFTMPGMGSFNIWSGVPAPNGWNVGGWVQAFNAERQSQILKLIQSEPEACVIVNRSNLQIWDRGNTNVEALPLPRYIIYDMPRLEQFGAYEIRVHPKRDAPWRVNGVVAGSR